MDDMTPQEELGPTHSSLPTVTPLRRSAPPAIKRLILELGLRYRPTSPDALEAHTVKLAALTSDCADIPANMLERAVTKWVRQEKFMPKASELIRLAREELQGQVGSHPADSHQNAVILANRYNARLAEQNSQLMWHIGPNNELKLAPIGEQPKYAPPLTREELDNLPADMVSLGLANGFLERRGGKLCERTA